MKDPHPKTSPTREKMGARQLTYRFINTLRTSGSAHISDDSPYSPRIRSLSEEAPFRNLFRHLSQALSMDDDPLSNPTESLQYMKENEYRDYISCCSEVTQVLYFGKDVCGWFRGSRFICQLFLFALNLYTISFRFHGGGDKLQEVDSFSWIERSVFWTEFSCFLCGITMLSTSILKIIFCKLLVNIDHRVGNVCFLSFQVTRCMSLFALSQLFRVDLLLDRIATMIRRTKYYYLKKHRFKAFGNVFSMWMFQIILEGSAIFAVILKLVVVAQLFKKDTWGLSGYFLALGYLHQLTAVHDQELTRVKGIFRFIFISEPGHMIEENELVLQQKYMTSILCALLDKGNLKTAGWQGKLKAMALFLTILGEDLETIMVKVHEHKT